jgi:hypothetical protein
LIATHDQLGISTKPFFDYPRLRQRVSSLRFLSDAIPLLSLDEWQPNKSISLLFYRCNKGTHFHTLGSRCLLPIHGHLPWGISTILSDGFQQ